MASPLVCILKGRDGKAGVRLAIDYRYINRYSLKDAYVMPNISDLIQKVGSANFITTADCRSGYWQLLVSPTDRWLTSFTYIPYNMVNLLDCTWTHQNGQVELVWFNGMKLD